MSRVVLLIVVVGLAGVGCSSGPDHAPAVKASYSKTTGSPPEPAGVRVTTPNPQP